MIWQSRPVQPAEMQEKSKALISDGIEGWLDPICARAIDSLLLIQAEHDVNGDLGEIGVYLGKTFAHLVLHRREGEKTFGVDLFEIEYSGGERVDFFEKTSNNIRLLNDKYKIRGLTELYRVSSSDPKIINSLNSYKAKTRLISIDGSHSFNDVVNDLLLCQSLISNDGVLVLDDFCNPVNPEVTFALYEFLANRPEGKDLDIVLVVTPGCSPRHGASRLFLQRKSCKIDYRSFLLNELENFRTGYMLGQVQIAGCMVPVIFPE